MRVLNCMWSSEQAFKSVHSVMHTIFSAVTLDVQHAFLIGNVAPSEFDTAYLFDSNKTATKRFLKRLFLRQKWKKLIESYKPEVIVLDGLGMTRLLIPVLEKIPNLKIIIYIHGETQFSANDIKRLNSVNNNIRYACVSKSLAEQVEQQLGYTAKVFAIPTYLNLPEFSQTIVKQKQDKFIVLGAIGRLEPSKNIDLLLDVVAGLVKDGSNVLLKIAGDGSLYERLNNRVHVLGIEENVKLLGFVKDVSNFYQSLDFMLFPSKQEGQGLVIQESLHYNVPIICNDLPVFKEQLDDAGIYCSEQSEWEDAILKNQNQRHLILARQQECFCLYNNRDLFVSRCKKLFFDWAET